MEKIEDKANNSTGISLTKEASFVLPVRILENTMEYHYEDLFFEWLWLSEIMYAKPKRGKTAQGVWKDIVNVKDYTQTLRMEKCL